MSDGFGHLKRLLWKQEIFQHNESTYFTFYLYFQLEILNSNIFRKNKNDPICLKKKNGKVYFSFFNIKYKKRKIVDSENE